MKKILIPPVFVLFCITLMLVFYLYLPNWNIIKFPYNLAGLAVSIFGFSIMSRARELFKKHQTTYTYSKASKLVSEGIFSKSRNPMYVGMCLLVLGVGICFTNLFAIFTPLLFLLLVHFISIPTEEKMMEEIFGQEFLEYKKRVRKWL
jgi:protein-S-isoprenylcysteine O-methyltransferase Ste14